MEMNSKNPSASDCVRRADHVYRSGGRTPSFPQRLWTARMGLLDTGSRKGESAVTTLRYSLFRERKRFLILFSDNRVAILALLKRAG